jgi:hypothetical protein
VSGRGSGSGSSTVVVAVVLQDVTDRVGVTGWLLVEAEAAKV